MSRAITSLSTSMSSPSAITSNGASSTATKYRAIATDAGDTSAGCPLSQPVMPRFFCGQLLTDQDLTDLVLWAQTHFKLARLRDGWGVACGLDLWTSATTPSTLTVGAGYAVSCGGDDLVVAAATTFDISALGKAPTTQCSGSLEIQPPPADGNSVIEYDIYLRVRLQPLDPRPAPRRGCCSDSAGCEYTRSREDIDLLALPASASAGGCCEPCTVFSTWAKSFESFLTTVQNAQNPATLIQNRVRNIKQSRYPALRPTSSSNGNQSAQDSKNATLLWLLLEERQAIVACGCCSCVNVPGVPLGRIGIVGLGQLNWIVSAPPFRRWLEREDIWVGPSGTVNLAPTLGMAWNEQGIAFSHSVPAASIPPQIGIPWNDGVNGPLAQLLKSKGVILRGAAPYTLGEDLTPLLTVVKDDYYCIPVGMKLHALVYPVGNLGTVVIGYAPGDPTQ